MPEPCNKCPFHTLEDTIGYCHKYCYFEKRQTEEFKHVIENDPTCARIDRDFINLWEKSLDV
jgi:hypothetical protein